MSKTDPLVSAWFSVDFGGQIKGAFRECTGMGSENEVVEYKGTEGGVPVIHKVPGRMKWNNITLKRGIDGFHGHVEMAAASRKRTSRAGPEERLDCNAQLGRLRRRPVGFHPSMAFKVDGTLSQCRK